MEVEEEEPRQPAALPTDLLLDIIARSDDVTTVVRCAAGSKALRRAMLDLGFLDRLRRRAEANGGFDPGLLVAVSYQLFAFHSESGQITGTGYITVQPPGRLRFDTDLLLRPSKLASSRDGLIVVDRRGTLLVCNTITGHVTSLPSMGKRGASTGCMYQPAFLSVDGAGRSFELFAMYNKEPMVNDGRLLTQTFSSREGDWGAAREIHIHNLPPRFYYRASPAAPAVVGRSVYWLCYAPPSFKLIILAHCTESAHASLIKLPQEQLAVTEMGPSSVILATTATAKGEKQLSLVAAEARVISTWTLVAEEGSSSISWTRQEVIRRREIASALDAYQPIWFSMFGERSGTVLFWLWSVGLVQLNLGTKKALVLWRGSDKATGTGTDKAQASMYEINLISVLECMKSF